MPARRPARAWAVGILAALAAIGIATPASAAPMTILYDKDEAVRQVLFPAEGPGLDPARGVYRQEPSDHGLQGLDPDGTHSIAKVSSRDLRGLSAEQIAARLRSAIDDGCAPYPCASHLVTIDEIGGRDFADRRVSAGIRAGMPPRLRAAALRRAVRTTPRPDATGTGWRLTGAMRLLAATPSPWGGSYASRVHAYIGASVSTAMGAGRGRWRNVDPDGRLTLDTYQGVLRGLSDAGGVWIETYRRVGARGVTSFDPPEWRTVPPAFLDMYGRAGGTPDRVHFVLTAWSGVAGGCADCTWRLAESTPAGRAILANGPGAYRLGADAAGWAREYAKRFP